MKSEEQNDIETNWRSRISQDEAHYVNLAGEQYIGFVSCQLAHELVDRIEELGHVDKTNGDLVVQANRMDSMLHEKDAIIQKLKRDVETLTERRNDLIGQKADIMSALWNLVKAAPNSLQCIDFHHEDPHESFISCPKVEKYDACMNKASEIIGKFIKKAKP